jgi:hypothetical protein
MEKLTLTSIKKKRDFKNFIEKVKTDMKFAGVYSKKAEFKCFSDNMFTYGYSDNTSFFEFTFMCDDMLLDKMKIKELLKLKNLQWFGNRIFCKQTMEVLISVHCSID